MDQIIGVPKLHYTAEAQLITPRVRGNSPDALGDPYKDCCSEILTNITLK